MEVSEKIPQMTAEEYREGLLDIFNRMQSAKALRYFFILNSMKAVEWPEIFEPDKSAPENGEKEE